jgi:three-Cys-motif partner protein
VSKKHTPLGVQEGFFEKPSEASRRKLQIVSDFFDSYMNVLARDREVGYADLFAGPGRYENGEKSAPLVVCEKVVADERLRSLVRLWFNEADPAWAAQLERNIEGVDGIGTLRHAPRVTRIVVSKGLAPRLERLSIPTFTFADPCGYKGLSLRLIAAILKGFGNDCLFFFNYNRVNMKLGYPVMDESINEFFEPERAATLRAEVGALTPPAREKRVLATIRRSATASRRRDTIFRVSDTGGRRYEPSPGVRVQESKRRGNHETRHEASQFRNRRGCWFGGFRPPQQGDESTGSLCRPLRGK